MRRLRRKVKIEYEMERWAWGWVVWANSPWYPGWYLVPFCRRVNECGAQSPRPITKSMAKRLLRELDR